MADNPNPDNPTPVPTPAPKEPETFTREYVKELRHESATYRTKAQEQEAIAKAAKEAADKAINEATEKLTAAEKAANDRIIRAELKAEALKAGMIDLDGLKLADLSKVTLDDKGEVVGAEEMMNALKEAKPYLFGKGNTSSTENPPTPEKQQSKRATEMSAEEYAAAKAKLMK